MNQGQLRTMYGKGYRFYCTPRSKSFEPLCVKTATNFAELCRTTYPDEVFDMETINPDGSLTPFKG